MGTSLCPMGNHKVEFKNKSFENLSSELKEKLNGLKFVNASFLKEIAISEKSNYPDLIARINEVKDWRFYPEDANYNFKEDKYLNFYGPFDLNIWIDKHKIHFYNPSCRYMEWLELDPKTRNEWRRYFYQIVSLFEGDRVIYFADNSHPLETFSYLESPLKDVELKLIDAFGEPKKTFEEVAKKYQNSFFSDRFTDLR
jgi:hypothetical protein